MTTVDPSQVHHREISTSMEAAPTFRVRDLSSVSDPTRRQIVSLLCTATFSDGGSAAATTLVEELLKLCGDSRSLLSTTLQRRFLSGSLRTPLYFAICSVDNGKICEDIHPVIKALLDQCTLPLLSEARDDIEIACCEQNSNALLQTLRRHPALRPWAPDDSGYPVVAVGKDAIDISFRIPRFLDRMLAESRVEFPFVLKGFLFRCTMYGRSDLWTLEIALDKGKSRPIPGANRSTPYRMTLSVQKLAAESQPWQTLGTFLYSEFINGVDVNILRLRSSGILGKERELSGKFKVEHWDSSWVNTKG